MEYSKLSPHEEQIAREIVHAAYQIHKELGPGLLEKIYEKCLIQLLKERQLEVNCQSEVPLMFRGKPLGESFRLDLLVEKKVIVEIKASETLRQEIWEAQLLSYLKLTNLRLGFLINFGQSTLKQGIKRFVL